jgi:hypothetical protein
MVTLEELAELPPDAPGSAGQAQEQETSPPPGPIPQAEGEHPD